MIEILLLVLSVSIDSFIASISYGSSKIKIPLISALIVSIISSSMLGVSLIVGSFFQNFISINIAKIISFVILLLLGFYRLFEGLLKSYINNKSTDSSPLKFKLFDFHFVLQIYANEIKADFDKSKILSYREAIYLSIALSLDSLAVGFGSSLIVINYIQVFIISIIIGLTAILLGAHIGKKFIESVNLNLSWLSGTMLIILAFLRAF
ncbi:sporulation membrane protein YtaF [Clostridium sp. AL.422]|uniref:sporulation membrane protein YtaF n=1 Tax=Clostridium TaxID=1485 RepID=UPI00293DCD46|nr:MULTISPECIES: sporulation membrane protein YtaF [unclassified Clostridium]MDV4151887.1 sporulation membrane protein YtaF [Clostridium sp. AL.422]